MLLPDPDQRVKPAASNFKIEFLTAKNGSVEADKKEQARSASCLVVDMVENRAAMIPGTVRMLKRLEQWFCSKSNVIAAKTNFAEKTV